jgi:hypothetical protein
MTLGKPSPLPSPPPMAKPAPTKPPPSAKTPKSPPDCFPSCRCGERDSRVSGWQIHLGECPGWKPALPNRQDGSSPVFRQSPGTREHHHDGEPECWYPSIIPLEKRMADSEHEPDRVGNAGRIVKLPDVRQHHFHVRGCDAEPTQEFAEILVCRESRQDAAAAADVVLAVDDE